MINEDWDRLREWLLRLSDLLARDDADEPGRETRTTLEQRIAIGLIEARARELRARAGEIQMGSRNQYLLGYAARLRDRALELDRIGMALCHEWPPVSEWPIGAPDKPPVVIQ